MNLRIHFLYYGLIQNEIIDTFQSKMLCKYKL